MSGTPRFVTLYGVHPSGTSIQRSGSSREIFLTASANLIRNREFHVDYLGHAHGPSSFCQPFLPDSSTSRAQSACRAARFPRVNEHTPAHRRSAWATRGLASHTELPKMVGTIPTYIVYDNFTQCFGHEPLIGATFFFNHRPLEGSHLPEGVRKSPAQLLIDQPHTHWLNILGFNRFQRS